MTRVDDAGSGEQQPPTDRISRRQALTRATAGLVGMTAIPTLLAACGSSSSSTTSAASTAAAKETGQLVLYGYPNWYGPKEFANFAAANPGLTVKNVPGGTNGAAQQIAQISTNPGAYDLTLAGINVAEQMKVAGLLEPFDASAVPNIGLVGKQFQEGFPYGIPTDFGKTGFAYRKDLIPERPTSWKELWELSKKYSGKVTMLKYESDVQGSALRYLGYSTNTKDHGQLEQMQKALLELKPHLQAILETEYAKALIEGTAVMAIDYDYDIAAAQTKNKNIVWVEPSEGATAYLEGWIALKGSKHVQGTWKLMNFHLEPKNYAEFINANGAAFVVPSAAPLIEPQYSKNPALRYNPVTLKNVEFEQYLGGSETAYRGKLWEEFLAA